MKQKVLLITPPFTQLNTPYPATAYLKGFLNTQQIPCFQMDLGIEVILELFSKNGLEKIFKLAENRKDSFSENAERIFELQEDYIFTIQPVISFLQNKNSTLADLICGRNYLPEANRFSDLEQLEFAFGSMGVQDKAKYLATLYLEDIGDFIKEAIDPHFGFSRYAERLSSSLSSFEPMIKELEKPNSLIVESMLKILRKKIELEKPTVIGFSIPFPGNLFGAFKSAQFIRQFFPKIKIVFGGGYANTELRSLSDERVFDFVDYVCLDDGEAPFLFLLEYLDGKRDQKDLKRVFSKASGVVFYQNNSTELDFPQREIGTPDYSDLLLQQYISVIEIVNPMHRLWSDGRWNKLTLAHGCYWGKCTFCDVSLDYIQRYEPIDAAVLCDRIEEIIAQTGQHGFHFVDEAAPPALMRDLAMEIIRRKITISWWTNIRFEKSFSEDLCRLLHASGCIAVSGGLEVASDRLLEKIKKGVTVAQVAKVSEAFTQAGIMVHAYLMYGFPTQTEQETIDSLEMVRQMFEQGVLQSAFWHQFAMTAHSPVGLQPEVFEVQKIGPVFDGFAENDLVHDDPTGAEHELFSEGLKRSLFNYMNGVGIDFPVNDWFDFTTPETTVEPDYIEFALNDFSSKKISDNSMFIWLNNTPTISNFEENGGHFSELIFYNKKGTWGFETEKNLAEWLVQFLEKAQLKSGLTSLKSKEVKKDFEEKMKDDFQNFVDSSIFEALRENGLLVV